MKKSFFVFIFAAFFMFAVSAFAEKYDNRAFLGEWKSAVYTDASDAVMNINYCDSSIINIQFKNEKSGYTYNVYQGTVKDDATRLEFTAYPNSSDDGRSIKNGFMELSFYVDNIWLSAYTYDGEELYNGMFKNGIDGFNPYVSPFSYNANVCLNNVLLSLPKPPVIVNGTTYVPLRGTFDAMNINVFWDEFDYSVSPLSGDNIHAQTITAVKGSDIIKLWREKDSNNYLPWVMQKWTDTNDTMSPNSVVIDNFGIQPMLLDGSSYIPLRIVAESFGANVQWSDATKTVLLTCDISSDTKKSDEEIAAMEDFTPEAAQNLVKQYYTSISCRKYPYYTGTRKYYVADCIRNGMKLIVKVDNVGDTLEYTIDEWNNIN